MELAIWQKDLIMESCIEEVSSLYLRDNQEARSVILSRILYELRKEQVSLGERELKFLISHFEEISKNGLTAINSNFGNYNNSRYETLKQKLEEFRDSVFLLAKLNKELKSLQEQDK